MSGGLSVLATGALVATLLLSFSTVRSAGTGVFGRSLIPRLPPASSPVPGQHAQALSYLGLFSLGPVPASFPPATRYYAWQSVMFLSFRPSNASGENLVMLGNLPATRSLEVRLVLVRFQTMMVVETQKERSSS